MTTKLVNVIALLVALATGVFAWQQWDRQRGLTSQVDSLVAEVAKTEASSQEQVSVLERLQQENQVYNAELTSLREKVSARSAATNVPGPDTDSIASSQSESAKVFSQMAKDPKLKEVARQWRVARIRKIYGDFVRDRHLNPQQAKQFYDLLVKEDARAKEEADNLLTGDTDRSATEAAARSASEKEDIDRQLKLLLGRDDYAELQDYKKSTGARMALLEIQEHFARAGTSLRPDQTKSLLEIMLDAPNGNVIERMETVLTPEQQQELRRCLDASRDVWTLRKDAAEEMKRKDENATPAPTPPP